MKSIIYGLYLLGIALVMSAASASAGSINAAAPATAASAGSAEVAVTEVTAFGPLQMFGCTLKVVDRIHSTNSLTNGPVSLLSTFIFEQLQPSKPHHGPDPVPEPITAVLVGAAMLIGGGILRRRQRRGQK
jgi:hypothetical protein